MPLPVLFSGSSQPKASHPRRTSSSASFVFEAMEAQPLIFAFTIAVGKVRLRSKTTWPGNSGATKMSEYQYYEFQRVDGRLGEKEMKELRAYSTRARITPTSFINEYNFGNFKGDTDAWMEKYFDGFLYLANWGTREVQLAVPTRLLPVGTARRYCSSDAASSREKSGKLILTFRCQDESGEEWLEGEGQLSSLLQIRNELAQGDLRSLYLGWLMGVQAGELKDSEKEPPVPPNLDNLSGPQANLANFLRLDPDLLAVAARNSPRAKFEAANRQELALW